MKLSIAITLCLINFNVFSAQPTSIEHSHDNRTHIHPLPLAGINHKHGQQQPSQKPVKAWEIYANSRKNNQAPKIINNSMSSKKSIQPFSDLLWTDGLEEIIFKLKKFDGLTELDIRIRGNRKKKSKSLLYVENTADISRVLNTITKEHNSKIFKKSFRGKEQIVVKDYYDSSHKIAQMPNFDYYIHASPIILSGIAFDLYINLNLEPGFGLEYPQKTIIEKEKHYHFPFVASMVSLSAKPDFIDENRCIKISNSLYEKYKFLDKQQSHSISFLKKPPANKCYWGDSIYDYKGNRFYVDAKTYSYSISYDNANTSNYQGQKFNYYKIYQKHISTLQINKNSSRKDMLNDL